MFHASEDGSTDYGVTSRGALINEANLASKKICEVCSAPASLVMNAHHRLKTLCAEHTEEFLRSSPPVINPENSPGIGG